MGRFGNQSGEEGLLIARRQPGRDVPEVPGEAGPSFDLRQHVGDTRGRQHTVAGKRQMPSFVVPGIIVLQFLGDAQSLASDQGSIRSEEHTSELQSLMRISYAVFCLKKAKTQLPSG